ncbi:hypothetical protein [Mesorhizobium sp.]|uniref:hypothetical protein n=1 Tax=Mesorhizobium sp. TaxID=1871066 RepID=UPI000FEA8EA6|nr:hypothetical protein [Mesorhizobium sp.]RWB65436.1 MAG: hypothetical protein EOQ49_32055 [Mesorhizobium sp.]
MQQTRITRRSILASAVTLVAGATLATAQTEQWTFEVGQLVSHRDQPCLAMVLHRTRTSRGDEVYGIRRLNDNASVRDLQIMVCALVPVADHEAEAMAEAEAALNWLPKTA